MAHRKANFSKEEEQMLKDMYFQYIFEGKFSPGSTHNEKRQAWQAIANALNSTQKYEERTWMEVKKKMSNIKHYAQKSRDNAAKSGVPYAITLSEEEVARLCHNKGADNVTGLDYVDSTMKSDGVEDSEYTVKVPEEMPSPVEITPASSEEAGPSHHRSPEKRVSVSAPIGSFKKLKFNGANERRLYSTYMKVATREKISRMAYRRKKFNNDVKMQEKMMELIGVVKKTFEKFNEQVNL